VTHRTRKLFLVAELAVAVLLVVAVHTWRTRDLLPTDERTPAPAFELPLLEGGTLRSAGLAGRPTVLYFFAPWCKVCAASAHQLRWFRRLAGDRAAVVMVALDWRTIGEVEAYMARHGSGLPVALGDAAMASTWRIRGYPTYYVLDSSNRIAAVDVGVSTVPGLLLRTLGAD
jgi:thiol-disulfide isomerase/thioredoxin